MKLLVFFSNNISLEDWSKSGILSRELKFYNEIIKKGAEVTFITYGDQNDKKMEKELGGIKVKPYYEKIYKPKNKYIRFIVNLFLPFFFKKLIKSSDLLKANQVWGALNAVLAMKIYKKPLLVRVGWDLSINEEGWNIKKFKRFFLKINSFIVYKNASHISISSDQLRNYIIDKYKIPKSRISRVPNFVDTDYFKPKVNPEDFIPNRVLSISRIEKQKNLSLLIKALSKTNYGLDIVGDGEMKEIISNEAKNFKVDVRFLGIFPNEKLANIYNRYPIYVICSNIEGNPKTLLESMSCGNAIIGTNVIGVNNIIVSKENGLLCEKNEEEIREAIIYLMKNPVVRKTLGNAAREKILKENSIQKFVDKEFFMYKSLLKIN